MTWQYWIGGLEVGDPDVTGPIILPLSMAPHKWQVHGF